ncbi:alpha/beta hydrolase [Agromyces ramosus]|uniref:Pimeloyl-ACP methyl ester carboxylesterase n=1 Tax=Agromyces ramosus TaxID=33879 RepID=A0ABU0R823_9MICO|nr:alpha/beta hydrolase [Agromyces ramosus]MDQ0894226.1 pimeloyl-ACP methyl ester carboxylesterase [Agromyces ramosus]
MATTREFRSGEHVIVLRESGRADGPDYVLVHGLGMAHEYWSDLAERLDATGTVYALDLPGFGDAPQPREPLSMEAAGELLAELLVAEGIDRAVLVGHSTGAQVASETAARHPELVDRLVLIGPTVNPRERTIMQQSLRFLQDVAVINPKVAAVGLAQYSEAGPKWFVANLRPMIEHRLERVLPQIAADTLVIRGEHDRIVPRYWAEEIAALVPKGRYVEVPGHGHDTMLAGVREVGELIARHAHGRPAGRVVSQPAEPMKAMQLSWPSALGFWALDYVYAVLRQLAFLTEGRRPPARWRTGDSAKPQVVLLPGVYEHWSFLRPLGDALNADGHRVLAVHGMGVNRRAIADTSLRIARALGRVRVPEAGRVLVAHSKGGLIGKHLLLDEHADALGIRGVVAVCTPFAGARRARLFTDPSIRALLPGDETIVMLGSATSVNARIVSVFGTFDPHIPDGSALDGATNIRVPVAGHFRVLGARETLLAVRDAVALLTAVDAEDAGDAADAETAGRA